MMLSNGKTVAAKCGIEANFISTLRHLIKNYTAEKKKKYGFILHLLAKNANDEKRNALKYISHIEINSVRVRAVLPVPLDIACYLRKLLRFYEHC